MAKQLSLMPFSIGSWEKDFFNRLLNNKFELPVEGNEWSEWSPRIDIKEEEKQFTIIADIPGVAAKDIHITVDKNSLCIRGEKESEYKEETKNFVHMERFKGSFSRTIALPDIADTDSVKAKSKNGVLEITVTKSQKNVNRKIEVSHEE